MKQYSEQELKAILRELAADLGESPAVADIQSRDDLPSRSTFRARFGSWNDALQAAGLERNQEYSYSRGALLAAIEDVAEQLDRRPTREEVLEMTSYSEHPFRREFGSWSDAMEEAGYSGDLQHSTAFSKEELLEDFREWANYYQKGTTATPTKRKMDAHGPHGSSTYAARFGSWTQAVVEAGLNPDSRTIGREELLAEISSVGQLLEKRPTCRDIEEYGDNSLWPYLREFGSWNAALREAGFTPPSSGRPSGSTNIPTTDLIADLRRVARKWGRTPSEEEYGDHGTYSTTTYSRRFGGWLSAVERAGLEPTRKTTTANKSTRTLDPEYPSNSAEYRIESNSQIYAISIGDGIGDTRSDMVYEVVEIDDDGLRVWPVGFRTELFRTFTRDKLAEGFSNTTEGLDLVYYYGSDQA